MLGDQSVRHQTLRNQQTFVMKQLLQPEFQSIVVPPPVYPPNILIFPWIHHMVTVFHHQARLCCNPKRIDSNITPLVLFELVLQFCYHFTLRRRQTVGIHTIIAQREIRTSHAWKLETKLKGTSNKTVVNKDTNYLKDLDTNLGQDCNSFIEEINGTW